jgi:hypothetical protein
MAASARHVLLALLLFLAHDLAQAVSEPTPLVPCNFTVEQVIKQVGWKVLPGSAAPVLIPMECTPEGAIHSIFLFSMLLTGNLSAFTPFMKDLRTLDVNSNQLTGEY